MIVAPLDPPVHSGDWHDKPLRWTVTGEGKITQHFRTKRDAQIWARVYAKTDSFNTAQREWYRKASK